MARAKARFATLDSDEDLSVALLTALRSFVPGICLFLSFIWQDRLGHLWQHYQLENHPPTRGWYLIARGFGEVEDGDVLSRKVNLTNFSFVGIDVHLEHLRQDLGVLW